MRMLQAYNKQQNMIELRYSFKILTKDLKKWKNI